MQTFRERLYNGPTLVGDAAKGKRLQHYVQNRLDINLLNLTNPELVLNTHRADVEAGADVVMTNTWDAPYLMHSLDEEMVYSLSKRGVEIAREAAGGRAYVVPVIGPVAWDRRQFEEIGDETAKRHYRVPLSAYKEAGLDGLVLETFTVGEDLVMAYKTAREILGPEIPIIALFGMVYNGTTPSMNGMRQIIRYFKTLKRLGADSIGIGCTYYEQALKAIERISGEVDPPFTVSVNVTQEIWRAERITTVTAEQLGRAVREYEINGATFVFPCCGGDPDYIRAMRSGVDTSPRKLVPVKTAKEESYSRVQSGFEKALMAGEKVLCIEPRAPQQDLYEGNEPWYNLINPFLAGGGKFFINLTDCAGGKAGINPIFWAQAIKKKFDTPDLETIVHIACSQATLDKYDQEMRTAFRAGIKNLLILGGDDIYGSGTAEYGSSVLEVLASEHRKKFFNAVSLDISVDDLSFERQLKLLREKVDLCLGRQDLTKHPNNQTIVPVFTQVIYDAQMLESRYRMVKERFGDEVKVVVGVYPLLSLAEAQKFMKQTGISIPEHVLERYKGKSQEEQRQVGVAIAKEVVENARRLADGIYLVQTNEPSQKAAERLLGILNAA